ncbi:MAG: acetolactate decarboxylase [Ruminococcus sp.]|nr:acetolactate decarboxylase [Ruminococcus sp.]
MKKILVILLAAAMIVPLAACSAQQQSENNSGQAETKSEQSENTNTQAETDRETIYQVALLQSLTQGYYDGIIKVSELKEHGDIGIGTFEGVNGE